MPGSVFFIKNVKICENHFLNLSTLRENSWPGIMRTSISILIVIMLLINVVSCEDEKYVSSSDVKLGFSVNTIHFDTVFPAIGSATQHLKVYNQYDQKLLISNIRLASGKKSGFKLNINGVAAGELFDVEIPPHDSIYIFVEVALDPGDEHLPFVVKDSIEFITNDNFQDVDLMAWGQDVVLVRSNITGNTTWTSEKPYLVNSGVRVERGAVLNIGPGTHVYFHNGTGLHVRGKVVAEGTSSLPIIFQGDRLDDMYRNVPNQWNGILLLSGSQDNVFNHVEIKNANIGLQVGTIENEGSASVVVANSRICNHSYAGIFALKSKIRAYNILIANYGLYGAALLVGGEYEFYHTTIAGYKEEFSPEVRTTSSLMLSDHVIVDSNDESVTYTGDLNKAYFANSIVTGDVAGGNEVELAKSGDAVFNFRFDHCLLQLNDTFNVSATNHYNKILKGLDPKFKDPRRELNFELDSLSPAKDAGSPEFSALFPFDLLNQSRTGDAAPDLGAYERTGKKSE